MKFIIGISAALCLGPAIALAEPPDSSTPAPVTPAPADANSTTTPAAATVPVAPSATAPQTEDMRPVAEPASTRDAPAAAAPSATARKLDEAQVEKELRAQGYLPQMRNGEKIFCRRESVRGSRLPGPLVCMSAEQAETMARETQRDTERMQQRSGSCLSGGGRSGTMCGG